MGSSPAPHLILLPGLGGDARMFEPQIAAFPGAEVPRWILPGEGESVPQYAGRFAAALAPREPFFLVGGSFGGMVALELARHLRPEAVFLIASCRSYRSVPGAARLTGGIMRLAPLWAFSRASRLASRHTWLFGDLTPEQHGMLRAMMLDTPVEFLRWGGGALARWTGPRDLTMPVYHIHGERDRVIPYRHVRPDVTVPGAGHLVNVTHAEVVNEFLRERMRRHLER